jgi:hypothetical protein
MLNHRQRSRKAWAKGDFMPRRGSRLLISLLLLALGAPAQAATSLEAGAMGSLQRTDAGTRGVLALRWDGLQPNAAGSDLGLSVFSGPMPDGWSGKSTHLGVVGAMLDLGMVYNASVGARLLVPRLALTALGTAGEGGGGAFLSLVSGVGFVSLPQRGVGFRADADVRWLFKPTEQIWSLSVGPVWPGGSR